LFYCLQQQEKELEFLNEDNIRLKKTVEELRKELEETIMIESCPPVAMKVEQSAILSKTTDEQLAMNALFGHWNELDENIEHNSKFQELWNSLENN